MNEPFATNMSGKFVLSVCKSWRALAAATLAAQLAVTPLTYALPDRQPAKHVSSAALASSTSGDAASNATDSVLKAMQTELQRATTDLGRSEQPPYYLSYTVYDQNFTVLVNR